mmetsp:Transcript_78058/g.211100  ORF Transcript_78058/g.211100 Transcript_78058/m.211100 type:complete len:291 (+) Transcript_78058:2028-2900(+)
MMSRLNSSEPTTVPMPASLPVYRDTKLVKSSGPLHPKAQTVAPATASSPHLWSQGRSLARILSTKMLMAGIRYASHVVCFDQNTRRMKKNHPTPKRALRSSMATVAWKLAACLSAESTATASRADTPLAASKPPTACAPSSGAAGGEPPGVAELELPRTGARPAAAPDAGRAVMPGARSERTPLEAGCRTEFATLLREVTPLLPAGGSSLGSASNPGAPEANDAPLPPAFALEGEAGGCARSASGRSARCFRCAPLETGCRIEVFGCPSAARSPASALSASCSELNSCRL